MTHLDDSQLVDALEGVGADPAIERHLSGCAECRSQVEQLRGALAAARSDIPAEPSPLFWTHFAARVNARLAEDRRDAPAASGWLPQALAWSGVLALVLAVVSIIVAPGRQDAPAVETTKQVDTRQTEVNVEADEAWAVLRGLAEDLDYEEAREAGVAPRPGAVDRAAMELNDAERAELARIIDAELKRIGP